ncbi:MAG: CoA-binding protein, partial [Deltaproteobacteria bacterium]|nr:CoA-binding protein [Deltaproteobacteria bacterium]
MPKNIRSIINPTSIAVVGATNRPESVGHAVFTNILNANFQGVLYPINPKARAVQSVKAYPSLLDVPDEIDMAMIIVPAEKVLGVAEQAAQKGVKGIVVITAGFKEVGGHGVELENELKELALSSGLRLVGPNCLGIINTNDETSLNASFSTKMPKKGNIAFISQSGALCTAVLDFAEGRNNVILMYLEDISDGRKFIEIASEITWGANKPMLAIKSGQSPEGARAAASHTGSLAGSDAAYDAIFFQSGIQRVVGVSELFNYAIAFANQPVPKENQIAIITNAGGPGIMATDAAIRNNLS